MASKRPVICGGVRRWVSATGDNRAAVALFANYPGAVGSRLDNLPSHLEQSDEVRARFERIRLREVILEVRGAFANPDRALLPGLYVRVRVPVRTRQDALLVRVAGRVRPWKLYPAMSPALLTAFSTASSAATLPLSLDCLEKRAGVSNRVASFVMPLGTSINHAGSALYECAAAMFIAQAYGLHLSFATQFTVVILALVTSMGIASIPAGSLVGIAVILTAVGLPVEAIGVLFVLAATGGAPRKRIATSATRAVAISAAIRSGDPTAAEAMYQELLDLLGKAR